MASDCPCCGDPRPPVRWGELEVSLDEGASWAGRRFMLSGQRLALLHHLARRATRTVPHQALHMSSLNEDADDGLLKVQISLLKKSLARHEVPLRIVTQWGLGYRLERADA